MRYIVWFAVAFLAVTACRSRDSRPGSGAPEVTPPSPAPATASDARSVPRASDAAAKPEPAITVAPLSLEPVAADARKRARDTHRAAHAAHKAGNHDQAIAGYIEVLSHDPGHLFARYNLASALASAGQPKNALQVLSGFDIADCRFCRGRLIRARSDEEWRALWGDPRFVASTAEVALEPTPVRTIVAGFMAALDSGDMGTVARFVHPNQPLQITETTILLDEDNYVLRKKLLGVSALQSWIRTSGFVEPIINEESPIDQGAWVVGKITSCDESCCSVESDCVERCGAGHDGYITWLDRVCIARDSGTAQYLSTVEFRSID